MNSRRLIIAPPTSYAGLFDEKNFLGMIQTLLTSSCGWIIISTKKSKEIENLACPGTPGYTDRFVPLL
jgi:hypothetical protein